MQILRLGDIGAKVTSRLHASSHFPPGRLHGQEEGLGHDMASSKAAFVYYDALVKLSIERAAATCSIPNISRQIVYACSVPASLFSHTIYNALLSEFTTGRFPCDRPAGLLSSGSGNSPVLFPKPFPVRWDGDQGISQIEHSFFQSYYRREPSHASWKSISRSLRQEMRTQYVSVAAGNVIGPESAVAITYWKRI